MVKVGGREVGGRVLRLGVARETTGLSSLWVGGASGTAEGAVTSNSVTL